MATVKTRYNETDGRSKLSLVTWDLSLYRVLTAVEKMKKIFQIQHLYSKLRDENVTTRFYYGHYGRHPEVVLDFLG